MDFDVAAGVSKAEILACYITHETGVAEFVIGRTGCWKGPLRSSG
jgi:hypothetical protein